MPERKHAVVTGGAGFIGSHLCEHLIGKGWHVTAVDDLSTGQIGNLSAINSNENFSFVIDSAGNDRLMDDLSGDCDVIFHLAAVVGVRKVMENAVETIETNLHTTETVLKAASKHKRRLLITSTSEVYGSNPKKAFTEEDDSVIGTSRHRRWCYAAGKLMDEFHAYAYHHSHNLPVIITRLFNTVGPRQVGHYGMVIPSFIDQALAGEPITVYGDGSQRRCFAYVGDTVKCLAALMDCDKATGEVFNVGGTSEITIMQLAETVRTLTGSNSEIVVKSYDEVFGENFVDMKRRMPDTTKLRNTIGFAPETELEDILKMIIGSKS